jgi:hypothetical protein
MEAASLLQVTVVEVTIADVPPDDRQPFEKVTGSSNQLERRKASATCEILPPSITICLFWRTPPLPSRIVLVWITIDCAPATALRSSEIAMLFPRRLL